MTLTLNKTIAYKVICLTFLLKLLDKKKPADETETRVSYEIQDKVVTALNAKSNSKKFDLAKHLKVFGGREQVLMFFTGPAGAGKSTAVKEAEVFVRNFVKLRVFLGWTLPTCTRPTHDLQLLSLVA